MAKVAAKIANSGYQSVSKNILPEKYEKLQVFLMMQKYFM